MPFRYDMQGKTPQQKIIVSKRDDEENKLKMQEIKKNMTPKDVCNGLELVIDKDTCPDQDNIIAKQQCSGCKYYKGFKIYKGQQCVICLYI